MSPSPQRQPDRPASLRTRAHLAPKTLWRAVFLLAISAVLIVALIQAVGGLAPLRPIRGQFHLGSLVLAILLVAANVALSGFRLRWLLLRLGNSVPWLSTVYAILAAWPLGLALPSRTGDVLRAWFLRRRSDPWTTGGAVAFDKALDLQAALLVSGLALVVDGHVLYGIAVGTAWLTCWVGLAILGRRITPQLLSRFERRGHHKLSSVISIADVAARRPAMLLMPIAFSALGIVNILAIVALLASAFSVEIALSTIAAFWPIAMVFGMVPITVGGVGTRDAAFLLLLERVGLSVESNQILQLTLSYSLVTVILPAFVGLLILGLRPLIRLGSRKAS